MKKEKTKAGAAGGLRKVMMQVYCTFSIFSVLFSSCNPSPTHQNSSTKLRQYYIKGEQLYVTYCSNCHQKKGSGLGLLYPPLDTSSFMDQNFNDVICLIKHGKQGEIIVNGKSFNKEMPGNASLSDLEIAEIATYIYNSWEHSRGLIDVKTVSSIIPDCN